MPEKMDNSKKTAFQLIILFGIVSLLGDIIYEGARSVNGPYLKTLGANAAMVGLIAGAGEFAGYAIRLFSGYFSDKTKAYWVFTFIGYGMLLSVPLLALSGIWQVAAIFIVFERLGKAMRSPAKDTILSQAAKKVGTGFGFGLHEAMDQIGAVVGPLIFTAVFLLHGNYKTAYSILWIPFVLLMASVFFAYIRVPSPEKLEGSSTQKNENKSDKLTGVFWFYTIFIFFSVAGFANFALLGYHFKAGGVMTDAQIPLFYAIAMGVDAVVALIIGKLYDKLGLMTLIAVPVLCLPIPFLGFSKSFLFAVISVILWGAVMGIHETIMKAAIADLTSLKKRGTGYGIFNTAYGLAWLLGSSVMGFLYDIRITFVIIFAVALQVLSIPVLLLVKKAAKS